MGDLGRESLPVPVELRSGNKVPMRDSYFRLTCFGSRFIFFERGRADEPATYTKLSSDLGNIYE